MIININLIITVLPFLLKGLVYTLSIAVLSCFIGLAAGFPLGIILTTNSVFRYPAAAYVVLIRGTPMLVQILFVAYGLPLAGIRLPMFWAAVVAIGCNSAAYISQIVRAGINAVGTGQYEASRVLGLSSVQTMMHIILPQAIRIALPGLGSEFVNLIKDSSLASILSVPELLQNGRIMIDKHYDALSIYAAIALCFLAVTSIITALIHYLEKSLDIHAKDQ